MTQTWTLTAGATIKANEKDVEKICWAIENALTEVGAIDFDVWAEPAKEEAAS